MLLGRSRPLTIYLPGEMIDPIRAWIRALYLTEEGLGFQLDWQSWTDHGTVDLGDGVTVSPHSNKHLASSYLALPGAVSSRRCEAFSLVITAGEFRAVFTGDLSEASELTPLLALPITVMLSELAHFDAKSLAGVLQAADIHALCLVHLSEEFSEGKSQLQEQMETLLPHVGDVMIPEDGEVLDF
jgi:hypothetical protein